MAVEQIRFQPPEARLADLRKRPARTRFAEDFANDDWSYGVNGAYLRELVSYWRDGYDWDAQLSAINGFRHFQTEIDDRSEEHTPELKSIMRILYDVFCLKKNNNKTYQHQNKLNNHVLLLTYSLA